jgi:hypothetical protein
VTAAGRSAREEKEAASPPLIPGALRAAAQQAKQVFE